MFFAIALFPKMSYWAIGMTSFKGVMDRGWRSPETFLGKMLAILMRYAGAKAFDKTLHYHHDFLYNRSRFIVHLTKGFLYDSYTLICHTYR